VHDKKTVVCKQILQSLLPMTKCLPTQ